MDTTRKTSLIAGLLFILTFVASIPALWFYDPVLNNANYIIGGGEDARVRTGALFEIVLAISGIGTAVALYPILRRQNNSVAIGYVATRVVESTVIIVGLISLLSIVTLRSDLAGTANGDASLVNIGRSLVAIHDSTFLLGPAFCAGIGNGLLLGYLMYKSGLVPRRMALFGMIGGSLAVATAVAVLFNAYDQTSGWSFLVTGPEIIWEAFLGIYMTFKGFRRVPLTASLTRRAGLTSTSATAEEVVDLTSPSHT